MDVTIPRRLRREPLIEVIWQAVFDDPLDVPLAEANLGILYADLRNLSSKWQIRRLPAAQIPPSITEQDPNLRYTVKYRIEATDDPVLYQVGDRIVSVNCRRPYVGWDAFKQRILHVQRLLAENGLVSGPDHHALRYLDLIQKEDMVDLNGLRLNLTIGDQTIDKQPLHLRVELPYRGPNHVLQIITSAQVQLKEGVQQGILIDLETRASAFRDWSRIPEQVEHLHSASKSMFFEQILKPEVIERFEPEY